MYPLAPSGMEYTHTNMQGSFSDNPMEQSVRRHMRVQGIANPMDAGHEFETTTGHLTSASELRKRMRSQILSSGCGDSSTAGVMMGAKAKNLRTLPGGNFPHQPVSAPEFQFLRPKQYISGTTNLPDQEKCEDFWKEYTKFRIICTYLLYPGKISFSDVNKNFVKTLSDESFRERWDSFLDAETQAKSEMDEWSENIEKEYTNQYLLTALSVYASTSFQNFCNVNPEVFQKNSAQVYSDLQSKARGDLADVKANSLERCPDFVPATVKTMYTEYPVLMGGLILSSKMAMHLLRWTPIFSMEDENFYNLLQLLQDRSDPDFISTVLSLYQCTSGLAEGKSATHAAKLLNIIRYNEKLSKDFPNKASLGSMCKSALMSMRSQAEHLWADSKEKDRFFTMNLSEFIDAIWVLRTPYMSKKPMEEIIRKATAELMADMEEPSDEMVGYVLESMQLTLGGQELIDDVILLFKPNVFQLAGYRDVLTLDQTHYEAYRSAQQRDYYYACLVQGAAVRIGIDKVWASPDTPAPGILDEKNFINVVWKVIQECQPEWNTQDLLLELEGRAWRTREQVRAWEEVTRVEHVLFFDLKKMLFLAGGPGHGQQDERPQGFDGQHLEREQEAQGHGCGPHD